MDARPGAVHLLATVQGLVAERERVRAAIARVEPKALAIGASPESAATLLGYERAPDEDLFEDLPDHDYVYSIVLREFGDVDLPPPDLLEAARMSVAQGIPLHGVDLPEDEYETTFTKEVSALGFLRYGRIQKRLARKPPRADTPQAFALAWDRAIRKVGGIARVEALREQHMAERALALARETAGPVLLVVDLPRAEGILARLRQG